MQIIRELSELKNSSALSADDGYWAGIMILIEVRPLRLTPHPTSRHPC